MWTRAELKARGKAAFRSNYWKAVFVAIILSMLTANSSNTGSSASNSYHSNSEYSQGYTEPDEDMIEEYGWDAMEGDDWDDADDDVFDDWEEIPDTDSGSNFTINVSSNIFGTILNSIRTSGLTGAIFGGLGIGITGILAIVLIAVYLLVLNPLVVGCRRFFYENLKEKAGVGEIGYAYKNGWANTAFVMFMKDLYIFLWTLLLIIPGIIKHYEYRLVPYILAEDPSTELRDALELSKRMMAGQKWDAFVLDLSFIGWDILSAVTFGLVGVFWVAPYRFSTEAALYETLHDDYFYRPYDSASMNGHFVNDTTYEWTDGQ